MFTTVRAGLHANSRDIAVISNNLANANTTGFKKHSLSFADTYKNSSTERTGVFRGTGVLSKDTTMSFTQGSLEITGMTLDLAVEGDGMFVLQQKDENTRLFSRAGAFTLDRTGKAIDSDGNVPLFFLPSGENDLQNTSNDESISSVLGPLIVEARKQFGFKDVNGESVPNILNLKQLETEPSGKIFARYGEVEGEVTRVLLGQVSLARFSAQTKLQSIGRSTFLETPDSGDANIGLPSTQSYGRVTFGALERSNVDVTMELLSLIKTQQAYSANARMLQTSVEIGRELINR